MDTTKQAVAVFDKRADQYQEKYMDVSLYHDTFDVFCENIVAKNADILEIACGPGNITRYILAKRPDFNLLGTDLSPNMIALAGANNPGAEFRLLDARDIGRLEKKFDGIMCGFCINYLSGEECSKLIRDAYALLKRGGVLYFSTMEDQTRKAGFQESSDGRDRIYTYYHTEDELRQMLKDNTFELISFMRRDFPKGDGTFSKDLIFIAVKN
jgi:SAM-dependent methyltransferase